MLVRETPSDPCGLDIGQRALGQGCPADEADVALHVQHGQHGHGDPITALDDGHQDDGQQQPGQGDHEVNDPHRHHVDVAAQVASGDADEARNNKTTERDHERPEERRARPDHQPGQDVAAQLVRAEQVPQRRWDRLVQRLRCVGVVGQEVRSHDRCGDDQEHETDAERGSRPVRGPA